MLPRSRRAPLRHSPSKTGVNAVLSGRGRGWGSLPKAISLHNLHHPLRNPPPQGGREQPAYAARADSNSAGYALGHFPAKACPGLERGGEPVRRRKCDQSKGLERVPDSEGTGTALAPTCRGDPQLAPVPVRNARPMSRASRSEKPWASLGRSPSSTRASSNSRWAASSLNDVSSSPSSASATTRL